MACFTQSADHNPPRATQHQVNGAHKVIPEPVFELKNGLCFKLKGLPGGDKRSGFLIWMCKGHLAILNASGFGWGAVAYAGLLWHS
jgi:hypothetical protein